MTIKQYNSALKALEVLQHKVSLYLQKESTRNWSSDTTNRLRICQSYLDRAKTIISHI